LELASPQDARLRAKEFKLSRDAASIFTFGGSLAANTKTLGPFQGAIHLDQTRERIATLDDVRVTVTRMTGQQNQSFLLYTLEYFITSHGWRTGDGRMYIPRPGMVAHEPYNAPQQVHFQNSAGGTMNTWFVGNNSFSLQCGDNRRYQLFHQAEYNFLGWFDDWNSFTHFVHGTFLRC
jgi:hypothetical protein